MSSHGSARSIGPHFLIPAGPKFSCHAEYNPLIFVLVLCHASFKWAELVPCWAGPSHLTPLALSLYRSTLSLSSLSSHSLFGLSQSAQLSLSCSSLSGAVVFIPQRCLFIKA
ncbi:unnamed protein product [Prunus armeniaca]